MTKEEGEKILTDAGYSHIISWHDNPGTVNTEHAHPEDTGIVVLTGTIDVITYGMKDQHKAGDFYEFKAGLPHSSIVGPEVCDYLVGKKVIENAEGSS